MMRRTGAYVTGDVRVGVLFYDGFIKVKPHEYCSRFARSLSRSDIDVCVYPASKLKPPHSDPVFVDSRNRVYLDEGRFYRYQGTLLDSSPDNWTSCQVIKIGTSNQAEVYLPRWQCSILEEELVASLGLDYLLAIKKRVLLHAAYIRYMGQAILFTAPSGTGKSTQADLWHMHCPGVTILNGDRAVLGLSAGRAMAYGFPFCGSSGISRNESCPLRAIIVLRQGKENHLERMTGTRAISLLLSECMMPLWDGDATRCVLDTVTRVTERCPVYVFHCLPDKSAVDCLYHVLFEGGEPDE